MKDLSKRARVCHITSAHPVDDIRIYHKECVSLAENGYDVHLVAVGQLPDDTKGVIHHNIPVKLNLGRFGRMVFRSWHAYRLARATQARVFHFHDPELLPYGLWLKWRGYQVIYDAHEDLPRDIMSKGWIPQGLRKGIAFLFEHLENFIARRLDKVVCATPFIAQRFQDIGANAIDVKNYPNLSELKVASTRVLDSEKVPAVCYVGMISIQRGIVEIIQAVEEMNVRLIIAGKFVDPELERIVHVLPGWKRVDYRGTVSRQGILDIFTESVLGLCLLHPSVTHNESMPNKLFEYMAAGIPVLASDFLSWQHIIENAQCGMCIAPQNLLEIRSKIQWFIDNPLEARKMGERGQKAVENDYNWEKECKRLLSVYSKCSE